MLFIGRMDPIKGVHLLIDAFNENINELEDWILLLVGTNTSYRQRMEEKVRSLQLSKSIFFLDPIFGDEKSDAYHAAEFIVIPSVKDAMTIIAPEASCCKKAVLITNTSQFSGLALCGGAIEVNPTIEGLSYGLRMLTQKDMSLSSMGKKVTSTYQTILAGLNLGLNTKKYLTQSNKDIYPHH